MKRLSIGACFLLLTLLGFAQSSQTITFPVLSDRTYGDADFDPGATASSGLTVTYSSSNIEIATIVSNKVHIVAAGTVTIYADQAGDGTWDQAPQKNQSLTIDKETLTITATGPTKVYGTALTTGTSTTNFTHSGEITGETVTSVTLTPNSAGLSATTAAGAAFVVTPSLATGTGGFLESNYTVTYIAYNGTVSKKALTVTATGPTKVYGTALTTGTSTTNFTHSGEITGETVTSVTLTPDAAGLSATTAAGAAYVVTPSLATGTGGFLESNYTVTYNVYNGTVSKKALTVTATGPTKVYGTALTTGTSTTNFTHSGEITGETVTSVTLTPDAAGLSATTAAGAAYVVTPSLATGTGGFLESNYTVTYSVYNGTVSKKALTVTATGPTKVYGTALTTGTSTTNFTHSGEITGETVTSVTLTPNAAGLSATTAAGAAYVVTPSLATGTGGFLESNYTVTYNVYNGTVSKKALTVTATGPTKVYGTALTTGTSTTNFTHSGEITGETVTSVTLTPNAAGLSATTAAGAAYVVTPSLATGTGGFLESNYTVTYNVYNGTVSKKALTVTATGPTKVYGTALTTGTSTTNFTHSGEITGETVTSVTLTPDAAGLSATTTAGAAYVVTPSLATGTGGFLESNYTVTYNVYNGTVSKKALTITANNQSKTYGTALTFVGTEFTTSGLVNSDAVTSVTLTSGGAAATAGVAGSPYTIVPSAAAGTGLTNYNITYLNGSFTVNKATLTITANNVNKTYGTLITGGTGSTAFTSVGLQNGETIGTVTIAYSTGSAATAAVGTYTGQVTASAATGGTFTAGNYTIGYTAGNIIVGTVTLTITANNVNKTYGTLITGGAGSTAFTSVGLQNGETIGTVTIAYGTGAAKTDAVGTYTGQVTASAATGGTFTASNYTTSYTVGNIIVAKAPLTITANNVNKTYGTLITGGTGSTAFTSVGLQNGETIGTVTIVYSTGSAATAAVGTYTGSVTASAATGGTFSVGNYTTSYTVGNIIVAKAPLTVTANNVNKTYGTLITGGTGSTAFTSVGLQNGETIGTVTIVYGTGAAKTDAVGTYTGQVTASAATGGTFTAGNYTISYTAGNIIVGTATLTITASNVNKTYGTLITGGAGSTAFTSVGLQNGETIGTVTIAYGTGAAKTDAVGTYTGSVTASVATGGTFTASNYSISYTVGNIIVAKATLTITANNVNKTYGSILTSGAGSTAFTSVGLQNGETIGTVTIVYGTGAAATAAVGTYTGSVTASAATGGTFTASNYSIGYTAGNIIVGKATLTITANNVNKTYGTLITGGAGSTAFTSVGLQNGETIGTVTIAYSTGFAATAAVGTYTGSVTASAATGGTFTASNYSISYTAGNIIVGTATLTITTSNANKTYGTLITGGTGSTAFTSVGLQNGETIGTVTIAYGTGAAATDAVGTYTGQVTASAATGGTFTASNYSISYTVGNIIVAKATLTITANNQSKTYGTAVTFLGTEFTTSGLVNSDAVTSVTLTSGGAAATAGVAGSPYTIVPSAAAGTGLTNYNITYLNGSFTVNKATLTITASNVNKTYGTLITGGTGSTAFTSVGLQNGETIGTVTIAYSTGSAATAAVGTYTGQVTASAATGGTFTAGNYTIGYTAGNIIVGTVTLTITANNVNKTYGTLITGGAGSTAFTSVGLQNGETISTVTIAYGTGASATDAVGTYTGQVTASAATGGTFTAGNYTISYTVGDIIVGTATLTVTANNALKTYGETLTGGSGSTAFTSVGLQNSETIGTVTITYGTGAAATDAAGTYTGSVIASAATGGTFTASNYTIGYVARDIMVAKATLTVNADTLTKIYGAADPTLTFSYSGWVNSEDESVLTTPPTAGTTVDLTTPVGVYTGAITVSGGVDENYAFTYVAADFTVTKAMLFVTADPQTKVFGDPNPELTLGYSGWVNSENESVLTTLPTASTIVDDATPVGVYSGAITVAGGIANNYDFTYVAGDFTVTRPTLIVTANAQTKVYGQVNPELTFTYSGWQNGDDESVLTTKPTASTTVTDTTSVGTYSITVSGGVAENYDFTYNPANFIVTKDTLTVTGSFAAANKIYDREIAATIITNNLTLAGKVGSDDVTLANIAEFDTKDTGTGKTVSLSDLSLSGARAGNYTLLLSGAPTTTADIYPLSITGSITVGNKVYDGNTGTSELSRSLNGVISPDDVTLTGGTSTFDTKDVGTSKTVTLTGASLSGADAADYSLASVSETTADITALSITGSFTVENKIYDGNTGTSELSRSLDGVISPDDVTLTGGTSTFDTKDVGTSKTVTLTGASLSGADAADYSLASVSETTADITTLSITGSVTVENKIYDGNTGTSELSRSLDGVISPDDVTLTGGTSTFDTKDVGTTKTVTLTGASLSGADAANYSLASVSETTADITTLSITGSFTVENKIYDGNTSAIVHSYFLDGVISPDDVTLTGGTSTFDTKDVGTSKTVTLTGASLSGADAANYSLASVSETTADITTLSITGSFTVENKIYDGNTGTSELSRSLDGVISPDDVTLTGGTSTFDTKDVGTSKTVTLIGASLSGADAADYYLASVSATTADIIPLSITGSVTVDNKIYDGNTSAIVHSYFLDGVISPDDVTLTGVTATFDTKDVGTSKTVTLTGSLSGADATDYYLASAPTTTADITTLSITGSFTVENKIYDGNTGTSELSRSLDGVISPDDVTLTGGTSTFDTKDVGTSKTVTLTGASLSGADAADYYLASVSATTADITPLSITGSFIVDNKIYDGNTGTIELSRSLDGVISPDDVTLAGGTSTFDTKDVGTTKTVTLTGASLSGADAADYYLASVSTTTADIIPKDLTITATGPAKTYGTALTAGTSTTNFTHSGEISGEIVTSVTLTPDAAGLSATAPAGTAYVVTPSMVTGTGGFLESNYAVTYLPYEDVVAKKPLTIIATGPTKEYGTALTAGTNTTYFTTNSEEVPGELVTSVTLTPDAAGLSAATDAGTAFVVTPSMATGTGGFLASNYDINYNNGTFTVTKANLRLSIHNINKFQGDELPDMEAYVVTSDLKFPGDINTLDFSLNLTTNCTASSPPIIPPAPDYWIDFPVAPVDNNYSISYTTGILIVYPKIEITSQPTSKESCEYSNIGFSVSSTGVFQKYEWQYRENTTDDWKDITNPPFLKHNGENTNILSLDSILNTFNGYQFSCKIVSKFLEDSLVSVNNQVLRGDSVTTDITSSDVPVLTVDKSPPPDAVLKKGNNILICTNADSVKYQWGDASGNISGATGQYFIPTDLSDLTKYWVITTNKNECTTKVYYEQGGVIIPVSPGLNLPVTVAPNPNNGQFTVTVNGLTASSSIQVFVRDYFGKTYPNTVQKMTSGTVLTVQSTDINQGTKLKPGIYFIDIIQGNMRAIAKIIVNSN